MCEEYVKKFHLVRQNLFYVKRIPVPGRTVYSQCLIDSYACRVGRTAAGTSLQGREALAIRLACRALARPGDQGIPAASRPLPCLE